MSIFRSILKHATRPMRAKSHGIIGERRVSSQLESLSSEDDEQKQIYNLILVDEYGMSHQIDHIAIRKNGIFCIETKSYIGRVFGDKESERWIQRLYTGEKHEFYSPLKQNETHCRKISNILGPDYRVNSLVVMVKNNAANINCENVINISQLKAYLFSFDNGVILSTEKIEYVYNKLLNSASDMTNVEHARNVKK